jgi:kanosamine-6-phosphate phosphatase
MTLAPTSSRLFALPGVQRPSFAVFSDFDESFFAATQTPQTGHDIHALRYWLQANVTRHDILFGFVTGSNIESVLEKLARVSAAFLPHFIGSSLGSEIHLVIDGTLTACHRFSAGMCSPLEFEGALQHLTRSLKARGYQLDPQPPSNHSALKRSFYLHNPHADAHRAFIDVLEPLADVCGLHVNCHLCNPVAGDPEGSLEVDITPRGAGKAAVVRHVMDQHNIPRSHTWAFGDSCNDLGLLRAVGNPYCLANATPELRTSIPACTSQCYAGGILEVLQRVFG